ncbi:hypothetical protein [Arthrobacter sp. D5-1]|uniref:hypothetical protein n=1 Tax=Arthrobacter sp. D5-1 TaxID=1477518 RepID=UPI001A988298|nr:hypothetical protein [Arthrobacter sp. D5-1]
MNAWYAKAVQVMDGLGCRGCGDPLHGRIRADLLNVRPMLFVGGLPVALLCLNARPLLVSVEVRLTVAE